MFFAENISEYLDVPALERMKALGDAWKSLDDSAKSKYERRAALDKERSAIERAGLVLPISGEWDSLRPDEQEEVLQKSKADRDIVAMAKGISRK